MTKKPASWISGLDTERKADQPSKTKSERPKLARYPKPLREMLVNRIADLEHWLKFNGLEISWKEALDDFRSNVHMGIVNPFYRRKYRDCGDIVQAAWFLDEVFAQLHNYQPEDYLTEGVRSAAARFNKTGKTANDTKNAEKELRRLRIAEAPGGRADTPGTGASIRAQVMNTTGASKRTVDGLASKILKEKKLQEGIATK